MFEKNNLFELEEEIEILARDFFSIPKDDINYSSKRDIKKANLITKLLKYYEYIYDKETFLNFSSTIFLTLENESKKDSTRKIGVLENYSLEKGAFLNYCNRSVKLQIKREKTCNGNSTYDYNLKKLTKIAKQYGYTINNFADAVSFGKKIGWQEYKIQNTLNEVDSEYFLNSTLSKIDSCFNHKQNRIKPYLSALLTQVMISKKFEKKHNFNLLKFNTEFLCNFKFIDFKIIDQIKANPKLKQQDIANMFGRDKTDAARMIRKFFEAIDF